MTGKDPWALHAGWLIDGTGAPTRKEVFLVISGGTLVSIAHAGAEHPKGLNIIDLAQCTILPCLVDSHAHLAMSGQADPEIRAKQRMAPFAPVRDVIEGHLCDHLAHGVVALRDGGDHAGHVLRYRKNDPSRSAVPVHLCSPGKAWHAKDRYGRLIGRPPLSGHSLAQSIAKGGHGIDHVKIVNSGLNSLLQFGKQTPPQFSREQLREAVRTGEELGLKTMIHANGEEAVGVAIAAGCHSIEHGFFMGNDNLKRLAEKGVTWVPTAFTMEAYARILAPGSRESEISRKNRDHQMYQIQKASEYGVTMAVGTDAGSPGVHHGKAIREEIALFLHAGVPVETAVQCATSNGARLLGLGDRIGTLSPGMPATFLVLRGDPGALPAALAAPERVVISGRTTDTSR